MSVLRLPKNIPLTKLMAGFLSLSLLLVSGLATELLLPGKTGAVHSQCSDGVDNDDDGTYDYPEDTDCGSIDDDTEGPRSEALFVSVTDGKDKVSPGDSVIYIITLRQQRDDLRDIDVDFHLPAQSNVIGADNGGRIRDGSVHWDNLTVQRNYPLKLTVQVSVSPRATEGKLLVARVVADGREAATDATMVERKVIGTTPTTRYFVSITDGREYARPDELLTYTIAVRNRQDTYDDADVRVTLPNDLTVDRTPAGARIDRNVLIWDNETFAPGERRTYSFTAKIRERIHDNVGLFVRANVETAADTDRTTIQRSQRYAVLDASITDNRTTVERGQLLTYTVVLRNNAGAAAVNAIISSAFSTYAEFVSATEGGRFDGTNVRWQGLTVAAYGTRTLSFTVRVRSDAPAGTQVMGSVSVDGRIWDDRTSIVNTSNEAYQAVRPARAVNVPLRGWPDLTTATTYTSGLVIEQTADRAEVLPNGNIRFTLRVTNKTRDTIGAGAIVTARYDNSAFRFVRADTPARSLAGRLEWVLPRLEPKEEWTTTYVLSVRTNAPHALRTTNIATITGDGVMAYPIDRRTTSTRIGVINTLPATGAPMDLLLALGASTAGFAGSFPAWRRLKKRAS